MYGRAGCCYVVGVHHTQPAIAHGLLHGLAGEVSPAGAGVDHRAMAVENPGNIGGEADPVAIVVLALAQRFLGLLSIRLRP